MVTDDDFKKAIELINSSTNALVTTHVRPDGDACGCMRAMCDVLALLGKTAQPLLLSPLADWYNFMFAQKVPILGNDVTTDNLHTFTSDPFDLVIIVDTNSCTQLPEFSDWLKRTKTENKTKVLVIDHHVTGDSLGDVEIIDPAAAAAGEIIFDLIKQANLPLTKPIAEALFTALATDTGYFRFGNTDSRLFRDVADLIDAGADAHRLYNKLYRNMPAARIALMTRMLDSMEMHFDDTVAIQTIMRKDFAETGATGPDTENLIDQCQQIGSVEVAVLLIELGERGTETGFRCSLRSKGAVDVSTIAEKYGGGGHKMASGVTFQVPLDKAKQLILDAVAEQLNL